MERLLSWLAVIVGAALVAASAVHTPARSYALRVNQTMFTAEEVAALSNAAAAEMQGAEATELRQQMVDALVDNELLYQYGLKLGLQNQDPIIRRRVIQLVLDMNDTTVGTPPEDELRSYYATHLPRYRPEPALQLRQIFSSASELSPELMEALSRITDAADFQAVEAHWGETLRMHDPGQTYPLSRLAAMYGTDFAAALTDAPMARLQGPLRSSLGVHWVWLLARSEGAVPPFESLRAQLEQDWRQDARTEAHRRLLRTLRSQADIDLREP